MPDIVHQILIHAQIKKVYEAISSVKGLREWWTQNIDGQSKSGEELTFRFPNAGPVMKVLSLESPSLVKWRCVEGIEEWIDTVLAFELQEKDGGTIVTFSHRGWRKETSMFAHCNTKWAVFMLSLKGYIEEGKGRPFPHDIKIEKDM